MKKNEKNGEESGPCRAGRAACRAGRKPHKNAPRAETVPGARGPGPGPRPMAQNQGPRGPGPGGSGPKAQLHGAR